jgi:hypothetical protein
LLESEIEAYHPDFRMHGEASALDSGEGSVDAERAVNGV